MEFDWSHAKNAELKERHGRGFEDALVALTEGRLLEDRTHPNPSGRYGHQRQFIVELDDYAWVVPFVRNGDHIFLKTMFPSRKATKKYLERRR
jgi:hypothetical protein